MATRTPMQFITTSVLRQPPSGIGKIGCAALALAAASASAQSSEEPAIIDEIIVTGYQLKEADSAMKAVIPIRDTPFSVSTYSEQLLKETISADMLDAYQYMTGVRRGGAQTHDLVLRGFKTTSNDRNAIMTDGLPGPNTRFGSPLTIAFEHIEVVKGPASVLYGRNQPGGFVNMITKKPLHDPHYRLGFRGMSYHGAGFDLLDAGSYAFTADLTGPIDSEERFLYRLVAEYNDLDSFRDSFESRTKFIMPGVTWNISDDTRLTLWGEYRSSRDSQDLFLTAPDRSFELLKQVAITTRYQEPGDFREEEADVLAMEFRHDFANGMRARVNGRRVRNHDLTQWYEIHPSAGSGTVLPRRARIGDNNRVNDYFDASIASMPLQAGFLGEHTILIGANGGVDSLDAFRRMFYTESSFDIDVLNPVIGVVPSHAQLLAEGKTGERQRNLSETRPLGFYLTDFVELGDHWKAVAGVRRDQEKQERTDLLTGEKLFSVTDSGTYPMAGIVYQPDDRWSLYASYATSFVPPPPNFQDVAGGRSFEAETGTQLEVGAKAILLDGRLSATLALFDIVKDNTIAVVPCNPGIFGTCHAEVGEEASRGVEFETSMALAWNWSLLFGYAYVDSKVTKQAGTGANVPLEGAQNPHAPKREANLWARYDLTENLGFGLGVVSVSGRPGNWPSLARPEVLRLPGYWLADLAAFYRMSDHYSIAFKVNNVFDKRAYEDVGSTFFERGVVPVPPRRLLLTFDMHY